MPSINQMTLEWAQNKSIHCSFEPQTTSTNDVAKKEFPSLDQSSALFLTDHQSAGRGRFDRQWKNEANGATLLSTWCFKSDSPLQPIFSPLVGLALCQSLGFHFPRVQKGLWVKPPNDLFKQEAKLSGLLIESSLTGNQQDIFIGLGINAFAKPQVDIQTACIQDYDPIDTSTWRSFCQAFYDGVQEAIHIAKKNAIPEIKRKQLLVALNNFTKTYDEVHPNGDLTKNGTLITWQDL